MSWLARSIANSLKFEDEEEEEEEEESQQNPAIPPVHSPTHPSPTTPRGVKEDISELTKTLSRQIWGVASFLAPDPINNNNNNNKPDGKEEEEEEEEEQEDLMKGIKSDFAEIGGRFKSGISKLSTNINVSEISKIASNFLQFGSEGGDLQEEERRLIGSVVGVTVDAVAFVRDISLHPETWLDFPVPDHHSFDDFDMSDAQQEHALAVERLAPRLAALRIELCPGYMNEGCFWKIYFVLLHPRLSKDDALVLSTPQIAEARALLSYELQKRAKANPGPVLPAVDTSSSKETSDLPRQGSLSVPSHSETESEPVRSSASEVIPHIYVAKEPFSVSVVPSVAAEFETEKHPVQSTEMTFVDKTVVEEQPSSQTRNQYSSSTTSSKVPDENFEDDADDWLKEETSEMVGGNSMPLENEEDVSFSDLEEDEEDVATSYKGVISGSDASVKGSQDWVQLSRSSSNSAKDNNPITVKHARSEQLSGTKESSDWLDVDDIDAM